MRLPIAPLVLVFSVIAGAPSLLGQCNFNSTINFDQPVPTISSVTAGDASIQGTVMNGGAPAVGTIQVCVKDTGTNAGPPQPVTAIGTYIAVPAAALVAGQTIRAQFKSSGGVYSDLAQIVVLPKPPAPTPTCSSRLNGGVVPGAISLGITPTPSPANPLAGSYSGNPNNGSSNFSNTMVQICLDDQAINGATATVDGKGNFSGIIANLSPGHKYTAYYSTQANAAPPYTASSIPVEISLQTGDQDAPQSAGLTPLLLLGGIDVSASASTDATARFLLQGSFEVPLTKQNGVQPDQSGRYHNLAGAPLWLSGYVRLASIAQPSGSLSGVTSLSNYVQPLTDSSASQVVQSAETEFYIETNLYRNINRGSTGDLFPATVTSVHFIAGSGIITPISADQSNPTLYQVTSSLYNYYNVSTATGLAGIAYQAIVNACGSTFTTTTPATTCYVGYIPENRTRFYRNWAGGLLFRTYYKSNDQKSYLYPSSVAVTIGQNEYVTAGMMRGFVLHASGNLTIPPAVAKSFAGYLYVYGAVDMNVTASNQTSQSFLLQTAPSSVTTSSTGVAIIPVADQNRDRYRFGIAMDLGKLFSLIGSGKTSTPAPAVH